MTICTIGGLKASKTRKTEGDNKNKLRKAAYGHVENGCRSFWYIYIAQLFAHRLSSMAALDYDLPVKTDSQSNTTGCPYFM